MTDQFKDKNEPDAKSVRSFKEQILAELEEAHRLRRRKEKGLLFIKNHDNDSHDIDITETVLSLESSFNEDYKNRLLSELEEAHRLNQLSETDSVVDEDSEKVKDELKDDSYLVSLTTTEVLSSNVISFNDDWAENSQPVEGQLSFDLDDAILLTPLSENQLEEHSIGQDETSMEEESIKDDLSITRVMAGFNKLFDGSNQKNQSVDGESADQGMVSEPESLDSVLEETQVYHSHNFLEAEKGEEDMVSFKRHQRQRTNRIANKISRSLFTLLAVLLLATAFFVYRYVDSGIKPLDVTAKDYIQVEIPSGSGNKLIGKILEERGVIKSGQIFNYYAKFKNYSDFKSGFYNFQKSMSLDEIVKKLQEGGTAVPERPALGKILIPEGYTLEQIAKAVTLNANTADKKDKTPFKEADFMRLVQDEAFIAQMVEKFPDLLGSLPNAADVKYRLEGYLYPATYSYYDETSLEDIVEQMLAAMDANLSPFYSTIANNGMTVNQVLTLASLVEKEGATDDDRKLIAGVFYNRWNQGMPLQSNIAILYAMGKLGKATTLLEDATIDTGIDSPYNIYVNTGLMPGPVDSPSIAAIKATINPEDSHYLYFVADVTTGAVYYAENYDDHSANVEKYINSQLAKNN